MNIPTFNEPQVSGKVSWFGGPNDPTDSGHTASGGTTKEPGIAIYNRATLGGYWRVTAPNGRTAVLRQTDLGPAPFTGRKVDVTYSALGKLGYNEGNFPTDSQVKATFLGKNPPAEVKTAPTVRQGAIAAVTGSPGIPGSFNQKGFQEAIQHAAGERAAASLFTGGGEGDAALREALQKAGTPPTASQFSTAAIPGTPSSPAVTIPTHAPEGNYVRPFEGATAERTDQGKDFSMAPGTPIRAIGDAVVTSIVPNWSSGQPLVAYKLTNGSHAGHTVYVAEQISSNVKVGQQVKAGQQIATYAKSGTGIETGWADGMGAGGLLAQNREFNGSNETKSGQSFAAFLRALGVPNT